MTRRLMYAALALAITLLFAMAANAQSTTLRTTRGGGTVATTRSVHHGTYTRQRTVTTAKGRVYSGTRTQAVDARGRVVTTSTHTGPAGESVSRTTTHGYYGNRTTVTGPNGGSRTVVRPKP